MAEQPDLLTLIRSHGLTLGALSRQLKTPLATLSRICSGTRPLSEPRANDIARALKVDPSEVFNAYAIRANDEYKRHLIREQPPNLDLKALCKFKGFSLTSLAKLLNISPSTLSLLAAGKISLAEQRSVAIANALQVDPSEVRRAYEAHALPRYKPSPSSEVSSPPPAASAARSGVA